jgi:TRAP-type C4-dicarboxylate transport system permease small subunit
LKALLRQLDRAVMAVAVMLWIVFFVSVALQVFVRYVLALPLPWTEEVAREAFIWCSLLTASVIVGQDRHFTITVAIDRLPDRARLAVRLVGSLLCLLFCVVLMDVGGAWSWRMRFATPSVLELPQGVVYAIIPFAGFYMALHLVARIGAQFSALRGRGPTCGEPV